MATVNHLRKQGMYFKALSRIVAEVNNADMSWPTVTSVELSRDNSHLDVFVMFDHHAQRSLAALARATGFVRSQLATFAMQRTVPQIHFRLDTSYDEGRKIDLILMAIKEKEQVSKQVPNNNNPIAQPTPKVKAKSSKASK